MAILYHRPVIVRAGSHGVPRSFFWQPRDEGRPSSDPVHQRHIVAIHRAWRVRWNWWAEETHRAYYRVETAGGGVYDLYQEQAPGRERVWYLERVWDYAGYAGQQMGW
jgi:hypothetical protein